MIEAGLEDSNPSESESSINDYDSFSNDDMQLGGEMGSQDPPWQQVNSGPPDPPEEQGEEGGTEDDMVFPMHKFLTLMDGLNKLPSWTVYPIHMSACLSAACRILQDDSRCSAAELTLVQRLIREGVPSAFEKCLDDQALYKWGEDIQLNILDAVLRLVDLVAVKLTLSKEQGSDDLEIEDDLHPLLRAVAIAVDKTSCFNDRHSTDPTPIDCELEGPYAVPLSWVSAGEEDMDERGDKVTERFCWLASIVNYMGSKGAFDALLEVLGRPEQVSINLLRALMLPVSLAAEFLVPVALHPFGQACQGVLAYVSELLENDIEELSSRGADKSYNNASQLIAHIYDVLEKSDGAEEANRYVGQVQCTFITRMLSFSNFNKNLSAVRETFKLLTRTNELKLIDGGNFMKTIIAWLEKHQVVKAMLRGSLHQKQYVDQVQRILQLLLQEGCMTVGHLDTLWAVTEKADTFETVKNNIYSLLVDLAFDFSPEQLDLLFTKFDAAKDRPSAERVPIAQLLCKIAQADMQGVMAERLVDLMWNIVTAPDAPIEVVRRAMLAEVAMVYEARGLMLRERLCLRCLEMVKQGPQALRGLYLLKQLVNVESADSKPLKLAALMDECGAQELILSSLEEEVQNGRATSQASTPKSAPGSPTDDGSGSGRFRGVSERVNILMFLFKKTRQKLPWHMLERLWTCLIACPATKQDQELGFLFFREGLASAEQVIDASTASRILHEWVPQQPAQELSEAGYSFIHNYFCTVNMAAEKLCKKGDLLARDDLQLEGLDYLWQIALGASRLRVSTSACALLIAMHTNLGPRLETRAQEVHNILLTECVRNLLSAGRKLLNVDLPENAEEFLPALHAGKPSSLSDAEISTESRRTARCVTILVEMIERTSSRSMPRIHSHAAAYVYNTLRLEIHCTLPKGPAQRFSIGVAGSDYVGLLRQLVAKRLGAEAARVRLLCAGHELNNDSKMIRQIGIGDGHVVTAAVSDVPNSYSQPQADNGTEDQSAVDVITAGQVIYPVLLSLADAPGVHGDAKQSSMTMLQALPTWQAVSEDLMTALGSDDPANSLQQLLMSSGPPPNMWLLYRVQALLGLLSPAGTGAHLPPNMPEHNNLVDNFLQKGCLSVVLNCAALPMTTPNGVNSEEECKQQSETCVISQLGQLAGSTVVLLRNVIYPGVKQSSLADTPESENSGGQAQTTDVSMARTTMSDVELDGPTITLMVHRIMGIAWAAGRGWQIMPSPMSMAFSPEQRHGDAESCGLDDEGSGALSEQDQGVVGEALRILVRLAATRSEAVPAVMSFPFVERLVIDGLFNRNSQVVRTNTVHALLQIFCPSGSTKSASTVEDAAALSESGACWLVKMLTAARGLVDSHSDDCGEYFQLLLGCLPHLSEPHEVKEAETLLASEVQMLHEAKGPVDESDIRLVGQLNLVLALIRTLNRQSIGASSHGGLVKLLVNKLLFPEAVWLQRMAQFGTTTEQSSSVGGPVYLKDPELTASLHAPCDSEKTRAAALELLTEIMSGDSNSLTEGVRLLMDLHYSSDPQWDYEHQPSFHRRVQQRYCGLKNAGATCYMNATIQQLFMTTGLRRLLLGVQEIPDDSKSDSVLYQLQVTFAHLALSSLNFYVPRHFWRAFKDYDGEPVNLREHQDAFEFLTRLQDLVDQNLSDARQDKVMKNIMGGKFAQQVICRGVSYRSETEQDFMGISVDVRGKQNLLDSLSSYVQGELMEGENAYYCEEVGRKVDAVKRACVKALPTTLIIHLKRFEFDFDTMLRWKIRDRFEFPTNLNMYEYTVEGLAKAEGTTDKETPPTRAPEYYQYELVGIVVHSGTAFAGHYYSYIKERTQGKPGKEDESGQASSSGTWWSFDDNNVEPWDPAQMDRDCFGGKSTMEVWDNGSKQHVLQEFDRPNSAYLLVYERRKPMGEKAPTAGCSAVPGDGSEDMSYIAGIGGQQTSARDNAIPAAVLEGTSEQAAGGSGEHHENYVTLDVAGIGPLQIQQSVYKDVMQDNLHMMDEMHRLDRDYLHFVRHLIEVLSDLSHWDLSKRKLRRTEPAPSAATNPSTPAGGGVRSMLCDDNARDASSPGAGVSAELSASSISEPRELQAGRQAVVGMKLATSFLLKVYMKAHQTLRDDMPQWRNSMLQMMGASPAANLVFLQTVCQTETEGNASWLNCYLLMCPSASVRTFFASLLADSLRCAVLSQGATPDVSTQSEEGSLAATVDILLEALLELTCHACQSNSVKTPVAQLFHVLYCYARLSPRCFSRLMVSPTLVCNAADAASRLYHLHFTHGSISMDELASLFGLLGLAVRHSDMVEAVENPYALATTPSDQLTMPDDVAKFFSSEKFLTALVELYLQHQDAVVTVQALTWDNPGLSHSVLQIVLDWLSACPVEDIFLCMENVIALITMNDQFQWARIRLMMSGLEGLHGSLRELIHAQGVTDAKRFSLIYLTTAIGECVPAEKVQQEWGATPAVKREWQEVFKWLEQTSVTVVQAVLALPATIFPANPTAAARMKDVPATLATLAAFLT